MSQIDKYFKFRSITKLASAMQTRDDMILEDAFSQRKQRIFSNDDATTKNLVFTFEIYTNKINKAVYLESIDKLINR